MVIFHKTFLNKTIISIGKRLQTQMVFAKNLQIIKNRYVNGFSHKSKQVTKQNVTRASFLFAETFKQLNFCKTSIPPTAERAETPKIYICIMILYWVTILPFTGSFLKLIYDNMQPNNRPVLTYDGPDWGFTATLSVRLQTNPFRNGVINFYYYICNSRRNNCVPHPVVTCCSSQPISHEHKKLEFIQTYTQKNDKFTKFMARPMVISIFWLLFKC